MSKGPENRFIASVHKLLDKVVYREKMHNTYRGGTPDCWYSSFKADLWVEYKWVAKLPKGQLIPALSALQYKWCTERYDEGRNILVVVGSPSGAVVLYNPIQWQLGIPSLEVKRRLMDKKTYAQWLEVITMGEATVGKETTRSSKWGGSALQGADRRIPDLGTAKIQIQEVEEG